MKIAVPTKENNQIDDHFGHCAFYTIFSISEEKQVMAETIVESPQGCGCKSDIASDLAKMDVKVMLAGGIGAQATIGKIRVTGNAVIGGVTRADA